MADRFSQLVLSRPVLIIVVSLVIMLSLGAGMRFLNFSADHKVFFDGENPELMALDAMHSMYAKNDNVLFVLAPRSGEVFSRDTLEAVVELTAMAWKIPYSLRVDSISNFQSTSAEDDDLIVKDLVSDPHSLSDDDLERIRRIAIQEPQMLNRLITRQGDVAGINVTIQVPGKNPAKEVPEVGQAVQKMATKFRQRFPDIDLKITGMMMLNTTFTAASEKDVQTLIPAMLVVILIVLTLLLRQTSATIAVLIVLLLSVAGAMGSAGYLNILLTPPTLSAPTIILTLAIADSVHILVSFFTLMHQKKTKYEAMHESLRINLQPVFLTSATTAIGFASMNFSDSPPFRDLGNISALGVTYAFVLSVCLLPALMMVLPVRTRPHAQRKDRGMNALADFVIRRRRPLLWGMSAITLVLVAFIAKNELNDEFVKYFDESVAFRQDTDFTNQHLTGIYTIEYSLSASASGAVANPGYLRKLERFADWYDAQPEVVHVSTILPTIKRLSMNLHGDDPAWYRLPDEQDLAAQYLLLYEMSLPFGLDLNNQINLDKSATRMVVTLKSLPTSDLLAVESRAQAWLKENAPEFGAVGTGTTIMFSHIGERNIRSMLTGTILALVLISAILVFTLASVKIGALSLIPNLAPAAMAFGLWGMFVGQVGLALSVVTGLTMGIVVDDTIHFLSKYLRARREQGLSSPDAVRYAFVTVGNAMVVTTIVLVAGFLILMLSSFELNSATGLLTAVTIALALLTDLFLLPPLLMAFDRGQTGASRSSADTEAPSTAAG